MVMKRAIFWSICRVVFWKPTDFSEENVASILRVEEYAKRETNFNSAG
jgi:hypothetical protein